MFFLRKKIYVLFLIVVTFFNVQLVSAVKNFDSNNVNLTIVSSGAGLEQKSDLIKLFQNIITSVLIALGTALFVLIIYAGILWMTAQADENKINTSKTIIKNSVIGLIVIVMSYGISNFVTNYLINQKAIKESTDQGPPGCCIIFTRNTFYRKIESKNECKADANEEARKCKEYDDGYCGTYNFNADIQDVESCRVYADNYVNGLNR